MYTTSLIVFSMIRIGLAFLAVFVWLPRRLFPQRASEGSLDVFFANFIQMVFWSVLVVYPLAALRLYEALSLGTFYLLVYLFRIRRRYPGHVLQERVDMAARLGLDIADGPGYLLQSGAKYSRQLAAWTRAGLRAVFASWLISVESVTFAGILLYSAYLRFADSVRHAAPALSDSYVTLAWMKYVERRQLFHDGIYPQGFHIYLSMLHKFSAVDPLLVLKYAGPLNGVLITISVYFLVSRLTGRKTAGLVGASVYGIFAGYLPGEFVRQTATNSQEFALVFLLPTWWFGLRYLSGGRDGKGDARDAYIAAMGLAVIGLVHAVAAVFAALGMLAVAGATVLSRTAGWRRLAGLAAGSTFSAVLSALPLVGGLVFGKEFHGSSAEFATASGALTAPPLGATVLAGLAASAASGLFALIVLRNRAERAGLYFGAFLTGLAVGIYQGPRFGVHNVALVSRSGEFLALAVAVALGLFWRSLDLFPAKGVSGMGRLTAPLALLSIASIATVTLYRPPAPPVPYKMEWDESASQYLRIAYTHLPTDWLIVSNNEGYALVLGRGWHMLVSDLLERYSPTEPALVFRNRQGIDEKLLMSDIYLFLERHPYPVPPIDDPKTRAMLEQTYQTKIQEIAQLKDWIGRYMETHDNMSLYYKGKHLDVYAIHNETSKEDKFQEVWGTKP